MAAVATEEDPGGGGVEDIVLLPLTGRGEDYLRESPEGVGPAGILFLIPRAGSSGPSEQRTLRRDGKCDPRLGRLQQTEKKTGEELTLGASFTVDRTRFKTGSVSPYRFSHSTG